MRKQTKKLTVDFFIILAILLAMALCSSGCGSPFRRYVHIHDRYPTYKTPEKTTLPELSLEKLAPLDDETEKSVIKAVKDLKSEAAQLRAILDSYNDFAKRKNAEYDQIFRKDYLKINR